MLRNQRFYSMPQYAFQEAVKGWLSMFQEDTEDSSSNQVAMAVELPNEPVAIVCLSNQLDALPSQCPAGRILSKQSRLHVNLGVQF
jgi:hypothetical protein